MSREEEHSTSSTQESVEDLRRALKVATYGGVVVILVAYSIFLPAKWMGMLPGEMTWTRVIVGPLFIAALVPCHLLAYLQFGERGFTALLVTALVFVALALLVVFLDSTW